MIRFVGEIARLAALFAVMVAWHSIAHAASAAGGDLVESLTTLGVTLASGETVLLPKPDMADDLDSNQQQQALRRAAGKYPLDRFIRNAVVSPFSLEMNSVDDAAGARRGQRIDFSFVAYGALKTIVGQDLFGELAGVQESNAEGSTHTAARTLTSEELRARDLSPEKSGDCEESYLVIDVPILNRVQLRGVGFAVREKRGESVVAGIKLDERFNKDQEFPNTWSPIVRNAGGKLSVGAPLPYSGLGGYMKITQLREPAGALFVECHIVFAEPEAWFGGKNLLRSKLPLAVQENVRSFRRKLADETSAK